MAHNLYRNEMAFTGEIPWHGLGTKFEEEFTIERAIEAAKLDYLVTKEPIYRQFGDENIEIPDKFVTVNNWNNEILGMVGSRYEVLQNKEAFSPFQILADESGAKITTAGALGNGERVWVLAKLPQVLEPLRGDHVELFMLLSNSHDGSQAVSIRFTPIRVVCQNTLTAAMNGTVETISLKHTQSIKGRLDMSCMILKEMNQHFAILGEKFEQLASFKINDEWLDLYEKKLFGVQPTQDRTGISQSIWLNKTEGFATRFSGGMGIEIPGVKGTAWQAYNAAVEWADYQFPMRGKTDRATSVLFGRANDFKQTAMDAALALVR